MRVRLVVLSLVATIAAAAGDGAAEPPIRREPKHSMRDKAGHLSGWIQFGTAYRAIFPFDEEYCGEDDPAKADCSGRAPFGLDLAVAYGLTRNLEALVGLGVGLERDFGTRPDDDDGPRAFVFAPGLKLYLTDLGPGDLAATLELPIDMTSYDQADDADFGVRNRNSWELPLGRNVWTQVYVGETASWRRWFRFQVDAGIGLLVRR